MVGICNESSTYTPYLVDLEECVGRQMLWGEPETKDRGCGEMSTEKESSGAW